MKEAVQNLLKAWDKHFFICTYTEWWTGGPSMLWKREIM